MAISRQQLVKELEPGLNALFGLEYNRYENQHAEIFATETSDRAFEEEVMLSGFAGAPVKAEGAGVVFDQANETFTARYTHETIALAFAITEEAIFKPLSSTNPAISINDCSSEVSLRSSATDNTFENVPPVASG